MTDRPVSQLSVTESGKRPDQPRHITTGHHQPQQSNESHTRPVADLTATIGEPSGAKSLALALVTAAPEYVTGNHTAHDRRHHRHRSGQYPLTTEQTLPTEALMERDAYLLHQVHPAKLAADVSADLASTWLMWRRHVPHALLAGFLPAAVASTVLIRRDLSGIRDTRRGRYVLAHMPPSAQAVRFVGQVIAWRAAYRHHLAGIAAGHILIAVGWSHGLLAFLPARRPSTASSSSDPPTSSPQSSYTIH